MNESPTNSSPIIVMNDVTVAAFTDLEKNVLEGVNWSVSPGEYWVIAGMQGSGKSDLMALTAGLMPPRNGSYHLFDNEMPLFGEELLAQRLRIGLVFDNGHLLHEINVHENIALPLRYHRDLKWQEIEDRVKHLLELTGLSHHAQALPGSLPRHLQKRAGLARALMLEPEVLLLDHPLSGLDLRQANWCLDFLDQLNAGHAFLQKRPLTLILTAEDLRPWQNEACRFAVLTQKQFISLGRRPELTGSSEPLVRELLGEELHAAI